MKNILLIAPVLMLAACGVVQPYTPETQSVSSVSSSSSVSSVERPVSFTNLTVQGGEWWNKSNAVIVSEATGTVEFTISRLPNEDRDFTSLGLYALHISDDGVYTEITDKRTLYIDSKFRNDNTRYIMADNQDFNTLHKGTMTKSYAVDCIPVAVQGFAGEKKCFNLASYLANGKVVLGFLPSNHLVSFDVKFSDAVAAPYKR